MLESLARRQKQAEERRKQILAAAARVFSRKGYDRATTKEIAAEAQISEGTIYNYFQNKIDLIATLLENNVKSVLKLIGGKPKEDESFQKFILNLYDKFMSKAKEIKRPFIYSPVHSLPSDLKEELRKRVVCYIDEIKNRLIELFKIGIDTGEIRPYPPEGLANFFMGMLFFASHDPEASIRNKKQMLDIFFYGIMKEENPKSKITNPK